MANEEKLAKFHQAINHYAMEQREKIEQEVAAFKKKELEEASNEVLAEAYHLIQKEMAQMRGRISREMARREMDGRRALLEKRSRIAEKVFAQAADILRKETESDRYSALLTRHAKAAHDAFARRSEDAGLPFPEDVVFLLNKKDQAFQETIRKAYGAPCVRSARIPPFRSAVSARKALLCAWRLIPRLIPCWKTSGIGSKKLLSFQWAEPPVPGRPG